MVLPGVEGASYDVSTMTAKGKSCGARRHKLLMRGREGKERRKGSLGQKSTLLGKRKDTIFVTSEL